MSFSFKNVWEYGRIRPFLTKTRVACSIMLATTALLFACSEDPETDPEGGDPTPPDSEQTDSTSTSKPIEIEYMEFNTASAVDLKDQESIGFCSPHVRVQNQLFDRIFPNLFRHTRVGRTLDQNRQT